MSSNTAGVIRMEGVGAAVEVAEGTDVTVGVEVGSGLEVAVAEGVGGIGVAVLVTVGVGFGVGDGVAGVHPSNPMEMRNKTKR